MAVSIERMEIARSALVLFVQSLSEGCRFSILALKEQGGFERKIDMLEYNESTRRQALIVIDDLRASDENANNMDLLYCLEQ